MLVLQLLALGLLLHESVYFSSKGFAHWRENIAPVLNLRLGAGLCELLHATNVISSVTLLFAPSIWFASAFSFTTLTLLIASFPKRLPNHLIVAWFILGECIVVKIIEPMSSGWIVANTQFSLGMVQITTILLYAIAGFHKLNSDYFSPKRSCGAGFVVHYLLQCGVRITRWPNYASYLGIYFVVIAEMALPILLVVDSWRFLGFLLAILLHVAFGFIAHLHFSVIMFAGIASFLPQQPLAELLFPSTFFLGPLLIGLPLGALVGNYRPYKYVFVARLNHILFGIVTVSMVVYVFRNVSGQLLILQSFNEHPVVFYIIMTAFILNGIAPYLGIKLDFSLAMFSNIRMDNWCHFLVLQPVCNLSPRYLRVTRFMDEVEVKDMLDHYFSDREQCMYSISYVIDVLNKIQQAIPNKKNCLSQ